VTFVEGNSAGLVALPGASGIPAAIPSVPRSVKNPLASNEANVTGTVSVLVAAKGCGVPAVVAASLRRYPSSGIVKRSGSRSSSTTHQR